MEEDKFSVIALMKNEAPYILEWVAHYKALGFDYISICTNECTDTTVPMLKRLEELGYVFQREAFERRGGLQRSAMRQAININELVRDSKWKFVCDADEFLNIHVGDGSVRDLVKFSGENIDSICIPWRCFTTDGNIEIVDKPITELCRMGELEYNEKTNPDAGKFVKSLFILSDKIARFGIHMPIVKEEFWPDANVVLPGGATYLVNGVRSKNPPLFDVAQVNHYALRSFDAFLLKRLRGRANHKHDTLGEEYWDRFEIPSEKDVTIDRYKGKRDHYLGIFHQDSQLHDLHLKGVNWHQRKVASFRIDPDNEEFIQLMTKKINLQILKTV